MAKNGLLFWLFILFGKSRRDYGKKKKRRRNDVELNTSWSKYEINKIKQNDEAGDHLINTFSSAPEAPFIFSAIFFRSIPRIRFIFLEWIFRISKRD